MRTIAILLLLATSAFAADPAVQPNVIYGMYSGTALLMDVHRPANPNGYGIILVSGSGWTTAMAYSAQPLKSIPPSLQYAKPLVAAGYTVFIVNHRSLPRFQYPAAVEDVQRAVRFVRHNATMFGINGDQIGAMGGSSGGHLVSMLGMTDGKGRADDPDPVEHESAKVQCVVARAAPINFFKLRAAGVKFIGMDVGTDARPVAAKSVESETFHAASPVFHVSPDDPPYLSLHGDKDDVVPFAQSEEMEHALKAARVPTKLIRIPGAGHGPSFPGATDPAPDYLGEMVAWFDRYLAAK